MEKFNEKIKEIYESINTQELYEAKKKIGQKVIESLDKITDTTIAFWDTYNKRWREETRDILITLPWFKQDSTIGERDVEKLLNNTYNLSDDDYDSLNRPQSTDAIEYDNIIASHNAIATYMNNYDLYELIYNAKKEILRFS